MVLVLGAMGHQLITTYAVNQAFAQHTAEASDLHPNKTEVNRRLDKLEEQQTEQQKTNSQVIRSLGRIEGALGTTPPSPEDTP